MKKSTCSPRSQSGFSMVEMIGVLAIIAILAAVIVPKVFSTISSSRVTAAVTSINTVKAAVADFVGKFGAVPATGANSRIDDLLLTANFIDSRFKVKIGTQPANPPVGGAVWTYAAGAWTSAAGASQAGQSQIISVPSSIAVPSASAGANYQLDGATNLPTGSVVVSAVIPNLTANEAVELSKKIDGDAYSAATNALADDAGKVVYAAPVAGITTAYIYLAHQ